HRKPRRPCARRLSESRRFELDAAHAVVPRRQPARLQAGQRQAADRAQFRAEEAHVLRARTERTTSMDRPAMDSEVEISGPATTKTGTGAGARTMRFQIYRYDPDRDARPRMQSCEVRLQATDRMLLDALMRIKAEVDDSLGFRRSCREGVCGSDAININGRTGLACATNLRELKDPIVLRPIPGLPVVRDLIVDMSHFFDQ